MSYFTHNTRSRLCASGVLLPLLAAVLHLSACVVDAGPLVKSPSAHIFHNTTTPSSATSTRDVSCRIYDGSIAHHVFAVSTGSGKITLYWDPVPGAAGYNIYRGVSSGGENYTTPVNGAVLANTHSYTGSSVYAFTDTGLTDGTTYYYVVKAVSGGIEGPASDESSDIPDPSGTPWDSGDPAQILPAVRAEFPDETMPIGTVRACGPDGRIYEDGHSTWQNPDGVINSDTGEVTLRDGTVMQLPGDGQVYGSGIQPFSTPCSDFIIVWTNINQFTQYLYELLPITQYQGFVPKEYPDTFRHLFNVLDAGPCKLARREHK